MGKNSHVAAYYYPGYHADPRVIGAATGGWTEWELQKSARPRFPGHRQPRVPVWGHENEADPAVMGRKIATAAKYGVDVFLFDWYWYGGPHLHHALDDGFLGAPNTAEARFALMWANHDWKNVFPRPHGRPFEIIHPGRVTAEEFRQITDHVIGRYFSRPNYWRIDGCPYFSLYDLPAFLAGVGGDLEVAAARLRDFRLRVQTAGFPDLHLNLVFWQRSIFTGSSAMTITPDMVTRLGFSSVTSYVWIHHVRMDRFPQMPYHVALDLIQDYTEQTAQEFDRRGIPYFPNVTVGWDVSARSDQTVPWRDWEYPYMPGYTEASADEFRAALRRAQAHNARHPLNHGIVTVNSWNEWTEGSYLEPDTVNGFAYLEAIRDVFGPA